MPTWLKVLLGIVVVAIIAVIGVGIAGYNMVKDAVSPDAASKIAHEMVEIGTLPPGWKYLMGMNVGVTKIASLQNTDGSAMVQFLEIPNPKKQTAEQLLAGSDGQLSQNGNSFTKEDSGVTTVGGQKMSYFRGTMNSKGQSVATEMGIVVTPSGKTVMIQEMEPKAVKFDPSLTKPVMDAITGFPGFLNFAR